MPIFVLTFKDQKNQYLFVNTYNGFISEINKVTEVKKYWYPDNCPPVRVGVWVKVRVSFRVGAVGCNQTIASKENCPPVRVRSWLRVSFGVGEQFSLGAIFLEPLPVHKFILCFLYHILHRIYRTFHSDTICLFIEPIEPFIAIRCVLL